MGLRGVQRGKAKGPARGSQAPWTAWFVDAGTSMTKAAPAERSHSGGGATRRRHQRRARGLVDEGDGGNITEIPFHRY